MPQNLFAQIVCPRPKVWYFGEKRLRWASVFRGMYYVHVDKFCLQIINKNY